MVKNLNLSSQAIYFWPKTGQNGQKRIFPDTTLPLNDWKQLFRAFENVMWISDVRFWRKSSKTWFFGPKWRKTAKREFFSKIGLEHFLDSSRCSFVQKFHQNLMRGSPDMVWRTDAQTDERESIGLNGYSRETKNDPRPPCPKKCTTSS